MVKRWVPAQGDIVFLQFNPQKGREQAGMRPALVLTNEKYNESVGLMIACPITSKAKGYPFEVLLPSGLRTHGVILADHVKSLDWRERQVKFVERASENTLDQVLEKLTLLLR
ncbi:MAG: endoribonuclease MazF [Candidatus Peribacteraceae bacterium]|nr:endoribonuclease MazF [Candidatus Peribacteraceae bacterium]